MPASHPIHKFKTGLTFAGGIDQNDLMGSILIIAPVGWLLNFYIAGLPWVIVTICLWYFVVLRIMQVYREVAPPKVMQHFMEWVRVGDVLYVTQDSDPMPLAVRVQGSERPERERPSVRRSA